MPTETKKKPKRTGKRKRRSGLRPIVWFAIVFLLLALLLMLLLSHAMRRTELQAEAQTAETAVRAAPPTETPPLNTYLAACFGEQNGFKTYISDTTTAELGIDVSDHQGVIDWAAVAGDGIQFAMIRAAYRGYSDGGIVEDRTFSYNMKNAQANGIKTGVYFFSQAVTEAEAVEEAKRVLSLVDGYPLAYPIVFDWEQIPENEARTDTISGETLTACAAAFCKTVTDAGYQAGVYFNLDAGTTLYTLTELTDYTFWLAEYNDMPTYHYNFQLWQYTNAGSVSGIDTDVDLNLSFTSDT